jgi:hypothetical protein
MPAKQAMKSTGRISVPLPELVGRVAVLGGGANEKTALIVGLAWRQVRQQGVVLSLDARRYQQTEVQFRLLLRKSARYIPLPPSGEVSTELAQTALSILTRTLSSSPGIPPLLLLDTVSETADWEQTLSFLLNAGVTVVEVLRTPTALVFGRYDTILLLREGAAEADALSRAVGRKVSAEEVVALKTGEAILIHLAQIHWVALPNAQFLSTAP